MDKLFPHLYPLNKIVLATIPTALLVLGALGSLKIRSSLLEDMHDLCADTMGLEHLRSGYGRACEVMKPIPQRH